MTPHSRHVSACARANIAALEWAEAVETGNGFLEEQAYHDFKRAYDEANQAFLESVKTALGMERQS